MLSCYIIKSLLRPNIDRLVHKSADEVKRAALLPLSASASAIDPSESGSGSEESRELPNTRMTIVFLLVVYRYLMYSIGWLNLEKLTALYCR